MQYKEIKIPEFKDVVGAVFACTPLLFSGATAIKLWERFPTANKSADPASLIGVESSTSSGEQTTATNIY